MNPLKTRKNADAQRAKKRHAICLLNNTIGRQGQTRLPACLSGAFCPSHLDGRQPACGSKAKNHSKMHRRQVRSSFAGAEMCPDKESPAGNTCRISKGLDAVWAHFCPSKPCLPLSTDGKSISQFRCRRNRIYKPIYGSTSATSITTASSRAMPIATYLVHFGLMVSPPL